MSRSEVCMFRFLIKLLLLSTCTRTVVGYGVLKKCGSNVLLDSWAMFSNLL